jgi:hypothetical protein
MESVASRMSKILGESAVSEGSQEQWEMADEILTKGDKHPAIKVVKTAYDEVLQALVDAAKRNDNLKKFGGGRTGAPDFIVAEVVPALRNLAEEATAVANQLEKRLG